MGAGKIARVFGMTNAQFAEHIGYSRQSLDTGIRPTERSEVAIKNLRELNAMMLRHELEEAKHRFEVRERAVEEFEQQIKNNGVKRR